MGCSYHAICKKCDEHFQVEDGGGFTFHQVRCDKCGKTKSVPFDKIEHIQDAFSHDRWSDKYYEAVAQFAGKHRCKQKGKYVNKAPVRCPKCFSTEHENDPDGDMILYD